MTPKNILIVNEQEYGEAHIVDYPKNYEWNDRDTKAITLQMSAQDIQELFVDDINWGIRTDFEMNEGDQVVIQSNYTDCSEYSVSGPIIDHRDSFCTIWMGKPTDMEILIETIYGGIN